MVHGKRRWETRPYSLRGLRCGNCLNTAIVIIPRFGGLESFGYNGDLLLEQVTDREIQESALPMPNITRRTGPLALTFCLASLFGTLAPSLLWMPDHQAMAQGEAPSFLNPARPQAQYTYRFPYTAVDPTALNQPANKGIPGFRAENQLMIYTPASGVQTGTNQAGLEAVVENGVIAKLNPGNSPIPANGFVISAHGTAAQWLARFGKVGSLASWSSETGKLTLQFTPATYLNEVDTALAQATARPGASASYPEHLAQAQRCRAELLALQNSPVTEAMANTAQRCLQVTHVAFYNTIPAEPGAFRGTWIRPESNDSQKIQQAVAALKQANIQQVFLETYYQGKTIYPSKVMAAYGLAEQHPRYRGGDPLKLWIEEAHKQGLKVHVWAQVFFAGNQKENSEQFGPILNRYPQWRNVQRPYWKTPTPVISNIEPGHYFLDPANPEVRQFLNKLLMEMVSEYDVDGLNLDYIRYPASAAVSKPNYLGTTWGYTDVARQRFMATIAAERTAAETQRLEALKQAGKPVPASTAKPSLPPSDPLELTPESPLWTRWVNWRKEQVSSFVKDISQQARALKPHLLVSAVVFPSHDPTYALKLQDYPRWAKEGDIQALTPIGLSTDLGRMRLQCDQLKEQVQGKIPVYVGIFSLYNRTGPISLVEEIDTVRQAGLGGVVLFDGARLSAPYEEALLEGPFRIRP